MAQLPIFCLLVIDNSYKIVNSDTEIKINESRYCYIFCLLIFVVGGGGGGCFVGGFLFWVCLFLFCFFFFGGGGAFWGDVPEDYMGG